MVLFVHGNATRSMEKFSTTLKDWSFLDILKAGPLGKGFLHWAESVEKNTTRPLNLGNETKVQNLDGVLESLKSRYGIPPERIRRIIVKHRFAGVVQSIIHNKYGVNRKISHKRNRIKEAQQIRKFADRIRGWAHSVQSLGLTKKLLEAYKTLNQLASYSERITIERKGSGIYKLQRQAALARDLAACFQSCSGNRLYVDIAKILYLVDPKWNPVDHSRPDKGDDSKRVLTDAVRTLLGLRGRNVAEKARTGEVNNGK